ncbi:tandem-95 repeat protein, partial [Mycolicibacterium sp. 120270]|uniref:tandem-95 repeat protein n=1 Tax=Mycolicibacterium sp. 120270 TaxID=3090600 RepID=UPI00299D89EB
ATATVTVNITAVNDDPVANPDTVTATEDTPLSIDPTDLLSNDTDVDGDTPTIVSIGNAVGGTVDMVDGQIVFTPTANRTQAGSFTYTITDGAGGTATATVTVNITAVNDDPTAVNDTLTATEDTPLSIDPAELLANDSDIDNPHGDLDITSVGDAVGGTVQMVDGQIVFTPTTDRTQPGSFTYTISDGVGGTATATVTVNITAVNDDPVAVNDTVTATEDTPLSIDPAHLLSNDTDVDGDTPTIVSVSNAVGGTVDLVDGQIVFTPTTDRTQAGSFTYTVSDGAGGTATATVTVNITAVNDDPVANPDTVTTTEDQALSIDPAELLANDSDIDNPHGDLDITAVGDAVGGTVDLVNGQIVFTPTTDRTQPGSFTYTVTDGSGGTATATVTVNITAVNDDPVANPDTVTATEDQALSIDPATLLANDSDIDNPHGDLDITSVGDAVGGTVDMVDGQIVFTPTTDRTQPGSFTYTISDGAGGTATATVTVNITAVNDDPVAGEDSYATDEDASLTISAPGVLLNDTDVDGDTLSASINTHPSHGTVTVNSNGSFTYTPEADYSGADNFTYRVSDGNGGTAVGMVSLTVRPVNDAPVAHPDTGYATAEDTPLIVGGTGVLGNDTDIDGDDLTALVVDGPANGTLTLNADGSFTYTPHVNFNGTDSFTYKANDGLLDSNTATVTVTVTAVNDAPSATTDSYTTSEDTALTITAPGVLANDTDAEGNSLTAVLVNGPANGTLTLNPNGSFTYTPNANFNGTDSFTYKPNDGTLSGETTTVNITVNPVNDAPSATTDSYTTNEDTALTITAPGVLANDTDADGNSLTAVLVNGPANGTLTLNPNGSFTYTPNANFNGTDSFTYKPNDGTLSGETTTVNITVNPVNDAPVAHPDSYTAVNGGLLGLNLTAIATANVLDNDTDVDGDNLKAELVSGPTLVGGSPLGSLLASYSLNQNGTFSLRTLVTPLPYTVEFKYRVYDEHEGVRTYSEPTTVTITVPSIL